MGRSGPTLGPERFCADNPLLTRYAFTASVSRLWTAPSCWRSAMAVVWPISSKERPLNCARAWPFVQQARTSGVQTELPGSNSTVLVGQSLVNQHLLGTTTFSACLTEYPRRSFDSDRRRPVADRFAGDLPRMSTTCPSREICPLADLLDGRWQQPRQIPASTGLLPSAPPVHQPVPDPLTRAIQRHHLATTAARKELSGHQTFAETAGRCRKPEPRLNSPRRRPRSPRQTTLTDQGTPLHTFSTPAPKTWLVFPDSSIVCAGVVGLHFRLNPIGFIQRHAGGLQLR